MWIVDEKEQREPNANQGQFQFIQLTNANASRRGPNGSGEGNHACIADLVVPEREIRQLCHRPTKTPMQALRPNYYVEALRSENAIEKK